MTTTGQKSKALAGNMFGGLKAARMSMDSNWMKEGHYLMRIDLVKIDQNRNEETAVFIECTVVHIYTNANDAGETMHRLGESCCQSIWKKHKDTFLGNVKAFLAAATGYPPTEIEEKHILQIIDDDQPLCGTVLEVKNRVILTKAKTPFTKINWKREVPPAELLTILPAEAQEMFFPDGTLEKMAAADAAA